MAYNLQKLAPWLGKYNTVIGTNNLEVCCRSMLNGVTADTRLALDGQIKELLSIGGKTKQRSVLRDQSVTEVTTPKTMDDEEIYIESIVSVINRYFASIRIQSSDNKIKSILVKLLTNNVTGFYDKLKLPKSYLDKLDCVFSNLIDASTECVRRFQEAIETEEYLMKKLPPRFEYSPQGPPKIYNEYFAKLNCDSIADKSKINEFMNGMSMIETEDNEVSVDVPEDKSIADEETQEEIIFRIKDIIADFGYSKTLTVRTDKFIASKFARLKDEKIKANLAKIIGGFHSVYLRLTVKVFADTYKSMFGLAPTTYKENKARVIKEIANISNSEEFAQFKRLLLE